MDFDGALGKIGHDPDYMRDAMRNKGLKKLAYKLCMEIEKLLKSQKEQILAIARKNGAYDVRIFGSVARGAARPDSDVDFLVKLEEGRSLLDLARLLRELQTLLGLLVDVATEAGLPSRI